MSVAAVVIGRNEGDRLLRCFASLQGQAVAPVIYVDSGSTDGSVAAARARGIEVVELDMSRPFTAARARNAGLARLDATGAGAAYVQLVDGDCEMRPDWVAAGAAFLDARDDVAIVGGRLRERFPEATVWNALADAEWSTGSGEVEAVGGIALARRAALAEVGGFREDLIGGEEPEMCLRLRRRGWKVWRLPDEMALHDAAMTRLSQWWTRMRRGGYGYAEGAVLHGAGPERYNVAPTLKILAWGVALPLVTLLGLLVTPWAALLLLAWPLQVLRFCLKGYPLREALALTFCKLPQAQGAVGYALGRLSGRRQGLIEYRRRS